MTKKEIDKINKMKNEISNMIGGLSVIINKEIEKLERLEKINQMARFEKIDRQCKIAQEFRDNLSAALKETKFEFLD